MATGAWWPLVAALEPGPGPAPLEVALPAQAERAQAVQVQAVQVPPHRQAPAQLRACLQLAEAALEPQQAPAAVAAVRVQALERVAALARAVQLAAAARKTSGANWPLRRPPAT